MRFSVISCLLAAVAYPLGAAASVHFPVLGATDALASALASEAKAKAPIPPSKDPFYQPTKGFEKKALGSILKHRPVPHPLLVGPSLNKGNLKAAYQILYRTNNAFGDPQASALTLMIPKNANVNKVLAYSTFYDAADVDCSPSYTLQQGNPETNIEGVIMSVALAQGWIVTVSDYEGPNAAFTVGKQAGHAVLDGMRATINSRSFSGIGQAAKFALFGYSGGALASEWAMEMQPGYAKELSSRIVGAAFGGTTPNVTSVILSVNGKSNSNLIPTGILGFASEYKKVGDFLRTNLKPATAAEFRHPRKHCSSPMLSNKNILAFFKQGARSLQLPLLKRVVNENGIMGRTHTPGVPLYIYKSTGDEVSRVADTDKLVKQYCDAGARIQYVRNHYGSHETQFIISLPDAFNFIKDRLDGVAPKAGCHTLNEKTSKMPASAPKILGELVYQELKAELQSMEGGG